MAALDFAQDGVVEPVDEASGVLQVIDDGRGMGQGFQTGEGGATLEVDKHEGELVRRVADHLGKHQGAEHLRLAGAGGADAQAVGAHAVFGGFLDVELDGFRLGVNAVGHVEEVLGGPGFPGFFDAVGGEVLDAQHGVQGDGLLQGRVGGGVFHEAQRGELAGDGFRQADGDDVQGAFPTAVEHAFDIAFFSLGRFLDFTAGQELHFERVVVFEEDADVHV